MFGKQTATCRILVLFCCHTRSTIQRRYRQLSLNHHRLPQLLPLFVTLNRSRLRWRKVLYVQRYRHSPTSLLHELVTALDRSRLRWRKVLYVQRYRHSPTSLLHELMTALDRSRPQVKKSSSAAWDPYRKYQVNCLEMVQRRAARFVTRTQGTDEGCVTRALKPPPVANPRKPKESCQTLPVTQNTAWQSVGCHALLCNSQDRPKDLTPWNSSQFRVTVMNTKTASGPAPSASRTSFPLLYWTLITLSCSKRN